MKTRVFFVLISVIGLLFMTGGAAARPLYAPVSTAFTYQGRLMEGGTPANGIYDFEFKLWDAVSGPAQVGSTFPLASVPVVDGLFTVELDFGTVFDGTALWLEIAVAPAGSGTYTTLDPRQPLTATPYAIHAASAGSAASASSAPWGGLTGVPLGFADGVDDGGSFTAGDGLTLIGDEFSVNFAGSGATTTAARSDHAHWGASWSGTGTGLTLSGGNTGVSASGDDFGVYGTSVDYGVYGFSTDAAGAGVWGENYAGTGVLGNGALSGVSGSGVTTGVQGTSTNGTGVRGESTTGTGVYGTGPTFGLRGQSTSGNGVRGHSDTGIGLFGDGSIGVYGDGSGYGVQGLSSTGTGVRGQSSSSGTGVRGESNTGTGVYGDGSTGVYGDGSIYGVQGLSSTDTGVYGTGPEFGVHGVGDTGVYGDSETGTGVYGTGSQFGVFGGGDTGVSGDGATTGVHGSGGDYGMYGASTTGTGVRGDGDTGVVGSGATTGVSGSGVTTGVYGSGSDYGVRAESSNGTGVSGEGYGAGVTGASTIGTGVYGEGPLAGVTGYGGNDGVYGDGFYGVHGVASSALGSGIFGSAFNGSGNYAGLFLGNVRIEGNSTITGTKSAVVETQDFGTRTLYSVESPENWFEDFGTGQLISGAAVITLEPIFAETVNLGEDYHVFVTPLSDCALYVDAKSPTSFAVHAMGGQTCSTAFDYRIVAKRMGYEDLRLAEVDINAPALVDPH